MKTIIGISMIMMSFLTASVSAQTINQTKVDEKSQMEVLNGLCNREALKSPLFNVYYEAEYTNYQPDTSIINQLKKTLIIKPISITIVMGSWCGDSQEQVPRFMKIVDALQLPDSMITFYCVDRTKKTDHGETDSLGITLIPTFIIFTNGKEIGRIVETPKTKLETDLLEIVSY